MIGAVDARRDSESDRLRCRTPPRPACGTMSELDLGGGRIGIVAERGMLGEPGAEAVGAVGERIGERGVGGATPSCSPMMTLCSPSESDSAASSPSCVTTKTGDDACRCRPSREVCAVSSDGLPSTDLELRFDQEAKLEVLGRREAQRADRLVDEGGAERGTKGLDEAILLDGREVRLEREDDGIGAGDEGVARDGREDVVRGDLRGQRPAVRDDRQAVRPIPEIDCGVRGAALTATHSRLSDSRLAARAHSPRSSIRHGTASRRGRSVESAEPGP